MGIDQMNSWFFHRYNMDWTVLYYRLCTNHNRQNSNLRESLRLYQEWYNLLLNKWNPSNSQIYLTNHFKWVKHFGIHDTIQYLYSQFKMKPLSAFVVKMKFVSVNCGYSAHISKKSMVTKMHAPLNNANTVELIY